MTTGNKVNIQRIALQRVTEAGLMKPRHTRFFISSAVAVLGFIGSMIAAAALRRYKWLLPIIGIVAGIFSTQVGLSGHDVGHNQVLREKHQKKWNVLIRMFLGVLIGFYHWWWVDKHNKHHGSPNVDGEDGDIGYSLLIFSPDQVRDARFYRLLKIQHWLLPVYFPLQAVNAQISSFRYALSKSTTESRVSIGVLIVRNLAYIRFLVWLGPGGFIFGLFHMATFGVYNALVFAPNHKGMPVLKPGHGLSFFVLQVITARNVRVKHGQRFLSWVMGGLEYQIEHHLFPAMSRHNLHKAAQIVREICEEYGVPYVEAGLRKSYGMSLGSLASVARKITRQNLRLAA